MNEERAEVVAPVSGPDSADVGAVRAGAVARAVERRDATDAEAKALASSIRIRILRLCLDEALSNREIAEATGLNPATALHHVRMLADTGFLEAQEARRGRRGAREIPYLATGKSWFLNAGDMTNPMIEAFVAEFTAAPYEQRTMGRMAAMLTEDEVEEFRTRIDELFEEFRSRRTKPDAQQWGLFIAMHPSQNAIRSDEPPVTGNDELPVAGDDEPREDTPPS
ncbi:MULTISPECIES: winged helix-turn-helix domain-containing protein [unclassified Brevibacterium]|uniref:ArsR/SmtB family transcription factor n=1 Tax=unclassified Brevibacterium TaxID=2614124 RepID=UPI001E580EAC|nr:MULTISPECIES: winged helix-turn-helix domain-containing protein [unclassified Brevibacterium]MCD1285967.1 ArsR family transcriptional regulator [Brevibacterium sp. CCUG 69071]MDK8435033.1 winged helix-turn-helix domain-containing protein [Brevibacterium sp. H-BE7]